jgi:hypothetical protein
MRPPYYGSFTLLTTCGKNPSVLCSLFIFHYSLVIVDCSPFVVHCSLFIVPSQRL